MADFDIVDTAEVADIFVAIPVACLTMETSISEVIRRANGDAAFSVTQVGTFDNTIQWDALE